MLSLFHFAVYVIYIQPMTAKKSKSTKKQPRALVQVWITPKAKAELERKAARQGLQVASYLRQVIYALISADDESALIEHYGKL